MNKIYYFTGTGNCLSVAKHFDAELLSIPQLVKDNIYEIEDKFKDVYIYLVGVDGFILNGESYEKCYYGVYSYKDLHKFYVYYEDKLLFKD